MKVCLNFATSQLKHFSSASETHLYFVPVIFASFQIQAERTSVKPIPISFCPSPVFSATPDVLRSSSKTPSLSTLSWAEAFFLSEIRDFLVSEKRRHATSKIFYNKNSKDPSYEQLIQN